MNTPEELLPHFLVNPDITFLNHGSFGACPKPVFETYQNWQRELEWQPVEFLGRRFAGLMAESRQVLADYLGTARDNLVYVPNATVGLNIVAHSLKLQPGDQVLTTNHEYGALDRTWILLSQKVGFKYINQPVPIPLTDTPSFIEAFWKAVTPDTKVIFISHITSPTAVIFPVKEICTRARQAGIMTVIDGAHAPGQISLNLDDLGADFYSGNLHKWLCAPKGSAFLYARPEVQELIEPLVISWGWQSENPGPSKFVDYLEWTGTRDVASYLTVPDAIRFQQTYQWDQVRERCHQFAQQCQQRLTALTGLAPLHIDSPLWYAQMAASPIPSQVDIVWLKAALYDQYKVEVPLIDWNGYKLVRYSLQGYNTEKDIDALVNALEKLLYSK
jgi:isopenicillin-N epimerase